MHFAAAKKSLLVRRMRFSARRPSEISERQSDRTIAWVEYSRSFAHARSVLHRDLKPANVMVGSFGEVLVMDWGLAKILQEPAAAEETVVVSPQKKISNEEETRATVVTGHGTVMGTPGYMSPEQERGETEKIDARSDIFSL